VAEPPRGTVTFLFTDLKSSTRIWEEHTEAMQVALARHDRLLRDAIESHGGYVVKSRGDGWHAAFSQASDALDTAIAIQRSLGAEEWGETGELAARVGLHTGEAELRDGDYYGPSVNRAARIMDAGHPGQILLSRATRDLVSDRLAGDVELVDLGEHRLRDLSRREQIFEVHTADLADTFPALRTIPSTVGNLPAERDEFVGRERELADLVAAVGQSRLVTLVGAGGVGKTRLAIQASRELRGAFDAGSWIVELAGVGNEDLFDEAVAGALAVEQRDGATMRESLLDSLRDKDLVLVLDNCEHLVGAAAEFAEAALAHAPGLRILATSREGLGIRGEHVFTVPVLGLPVGDADVATLRESDAVRLFVARAAEVTGERAVRDDELADIAALCRRLDGLPLAIELAAARRRSMTPAEIAAHLDRRFRMLTAGRRTAVSRHQAMRNAIDWSYDLLDDEERTVLQRAAVFAGTFDLDAAEAVLADDDLDALDVVDVLGRLVDKSLVVAETGGNETRYRLLETIRDYAWERLDEAGAVDPTSRRHAEHFVAFAERAGSGLRGRDEAEWIDRVEDELDNLFGALRWAIAADDADVALRLVAPLAVSGTGAGSPFGALAEEAAEMAGAHDHVLRPIALAAACYSARRAEPERALALAERAVAATEDGEIDEAERDRLLARCIARIARAVLLAVTGTELMPHAADEALADAERLGDPYLLCEVWNVHGAYTHTVDESLAAAELGVRYARETGNPSRLAFSLLLMATQTRLTDSGRARRLLDEAAEYAASVRHAYAMEFVLQTLAHIQLAEGDVPGAVESLTEAFDRANWNGDHFTAALLVELFAVALTVTGHLEDALTLAAWRYGPERIPATGWIGDELGVLMERTTAEQREDAARRADDMTDVELVALARERLGSPLLP
jgi:predicted ATPase/class 3 adenylate cyclase